MENENLNNDEQNTNKPQKSGKAKKIVLGIILLVLMLAIGILVGMMISGKGDTIIDKKQETIKGEDEDNNSSTDINNTNKTVNLSQNNIGYGSDNNSSASTEISDDNQTPTVSNVITKEDYVKTWETDPEDTEIKLYENGTFVTDRYTESSKIKGNYKVDNNIIELKTEDGKKWEGIFLIESGEITLNIKMNGEELKFYDMKNHTSMEKVDGVYTTTELSVKGKYENKSENDGHYYNATINVTDQGESIIEFEISAVNGTDVEHVNIGELKGIAKKVGTNRYVYEENIDKKDYKITFTFDAHRTFQWVKVEESYYPDSNNPYAGHGVYFTGEYEKVY